MKRILSVLLMLAAGTAGAQTGQPAGEAVITESFIISELSTTGGIADIDFALAFTEQDGRVVVCAATAAPLSGTLRQIMRAMVITEGSRTILRGLQWAPNYPAGTDLIGQTAGCQATRHPAPETPDFGFDLSRTRF